MNTHPKKTLIIGASENPERYANIAAHRLALKGHPVVNIGKNPGIVAGVPIYTEKKYFDDIHTVTLYINPSHQQEWYDYILQLKPKRLIFNPGTENPEFFQLASKQGMEVIEACTLVLLSIDSY
jgi:predicted CoA-binding protein